MHILLHTRIKRAQDLQFYYIMIFFKNIVTVVVLYVYYSCELTVLGSSVLRTNEVYKTLKITLKK